MPEIRIAVLDDVASDLSLISNYVRRYASEPENRVVEIKLDCFSDSGLFIENYVPQYDILFIDVCMPLVSGLEVARSIRKLDNSVCIIFVTNMAQYALDAFEVDAMGYMIKPVHYGDFTIRMRKAISVVLHNKGEYIALKTVDGYRKVNTADILYFEAKGHIMHGKCRNGEIIQVRTTMRELETALQKYSFARCNHSYLINLRHVDVVKVSVLVGNEEIPLGRKWKDSFLSAFLDSLG